VCKNDLVCEVWWASGPASSHAAAHSAFQGRGVGAVDVVSGGPLSRIAMSGRTSRVNRRRWPVFDHRLQRLQCVQTELLGGAAARACRSKLTDMALTTKANTPPGHQGSTGRDQIQVRRCLVCVGRSPTSMGADERAPCDHITRW
jgi:hypothetical protein